MCSRIIRTVTLSVATLAIIASRPVLSATNHTQNLQLIAQQQAEITFLRARHAQLRVDLAVLWQRLNASGISDCAVCVKP